MQKKIADSQLVLLNGIALPEGGGVGSDVEVLSTACKVGAVCELCIVAKTAIAINSASSFFIEILKGTTAANCDSPSSDTDLRTFAVWKSATEGAVAISAGGDIIPPIYLGEDWIGSYVQLKLSSNEDLSLQTVDAFLRPVL